jgi:hypothetical protein
MDDFSEGFFGHSSNLTSSAFASKSHESFNYSSLFESLRGDFKQVSAEIRVFRHRLRILKNFSAAPRQQGEKCEEKKSAKATERVEGSTDIAPWREKEMEANLLVH